MKNAKASRLKGAKRRSRGAGHNSTMVKSTKRSDKNREASEEESMVEEEQPATPKASPQKAAEPVKTQDKQPDTPKASPQKAAEPVKTQKTPPSEKPVALAAPKKTQEFVITVDNVSGLPTKIEKLDSETGKRKEFSQAEYLQVASLSSPQPALNFLAFANSAGTEAESAALAEAYYRGVIDYMNALSST